MAFKSIMLAGVALLAAPALAAAPTPAPAPAQPPVAPAIDVETARNAVAHTDFNRLISDRAYAAQMLAYLDRLATVTGGDVGASLNVDMLRLFALATLERGDEIRTVVDRMLERRPREPHLYGGPLYATLAITDVERAVAVVETASRNVPASGWADLRGLFGREAIGPVFHELQTRHDGAARVRLADALFHIGWPGDGDTQGADFLRSILLEDRIAHDDNAAAAGIAAGITTPTGVLPLIVRTRYDRLIAPGQDRIALFRQALDSRDRDTAAALAAAPADQRRLLDRMQYLRVMGRDAEALALAQPFLRDVRATVAAGEEGMWVVNEAAYALVALDRPDEGLRLMGRLSDLPISANGALIATSINHGLMLSETGHYREALDHATRLERDQDHTANGYGKMWIASTIVCALAGLNRTGEAAPYLARMRAQSDDNPNALIRADLCAGDRDAAAAVLVHWLESDDPEPALLTLQDYSLSKGVGQTGPIYRDLLALRDRPAVRAALDRVGRALTLPVARTGWTDF